MHARATSDCAAPAAVVSPPPLLRLAARAKQGQIQERIRSWDDERPRKQIFNSGARATRATKDRAGLAIVDPLLRLVVHGRGEGDVAGLRYELRVARRNVVAEELAKLGLIE